MKKLLLGLFLTTTILSYGRVVSRPVSVRPSISRPAVSRPTPIRVSSPKPVSVRPSTVRPTVHKATPIKTSTPKSTNSFFRNTTKTSTTIPVKTYTDTKTSNSSFYSTPSSNFIGTSSSSSNWFNNWWLYRNISNNRKCEKNIDRIIIEIEREITELGKDKVKNTRQIEFLKNILRKLKGEI